MTSATRTGQPPPTAKVSDVISNFQPARRFGNSSAHAITSIDFDDTGELCLVAQDDDTLQIYNCKEGKHAKELKSQKYGVDLARFTHHPQSIIYASTKGDDAIRYLSSHDNVYLRYFRGHTQPVTCITLNPANDTFLSASLDDTVRLWDVRSQNAQGQLNLTSPYLCAYDPTASVIAIACLAAQSILLYDSRQYDKVPFATFDLHKEESDYLQGTHGPGSWTKIEFANDGTKLLVATTGSGHFVLDAFTGDLSAFCLRSHGHTNRTPPSELRALRGAQMVPNSTAGGGRMAKPGQASSQGDVCFSPDGKYLIGGGGDADIHVWDMNACESLRQDKTLRPMCDLAGGTKFAASNRVIAYNPRHNLLATADRNLIFWQPEM